MKQMLVAYYNPDTGEFEDVRISQSFEEETDLLQADVLDDLMGHLRQLYTEKAERALTGGH